MANTKVTKILMRNGTKLEWDMAANPVLEVGEIGVEIDTYRLKIGTNDIGPLPWANFEYFAAGITNVKGPDTVTSYGLTVDSIGTLELDIDSVIDAVNDKVNRSGDSMSGGLFTQSIEAYSGAIYGGLTVDSNSAFKDGLEIHGGLTAHTNAAVGAGLVVGDQIDAMALHVTNSIVAEQSIESHGNILARSARLNDNPDGPGSDTIIPFIATKPEDVVTLAKLDGILDDRVAIDGDTMTGVLVVPGLEADGIIAGNLTVLTNSSIGGGLEIHQGLTVEANVSVGGGLGVADEIDAMALHVTNSIVAGQSIESQGNLLARSGKLNDFDPLVHNPGDVFPFMATADEDIVTLAKLDNAIDGFEDSIIALDSLVGELNDTVVYHDSVLTYHNGLLASLNGEIDGHTLRLDELDSITSDLTDSITALSSRVDTVSATANSALTGYALNAQEIIDIKDDISAMITTDNMQWDSIGHLDTIKITQDEIPTAKNRPVDQYRADGGKIVRSVAPDGNYKYTYTPSLPLAEIVDSVVGFMGGSPPYNDTQATAAINHFFDLVLTTYQPNITFSADDLDT